jgi:allantoate deiminase
MGHTAAKKLVAWLDELGRISDERDGLTRTFLSPAMRRANARVARWMTAVGLAVREDPMGNLIGRLEGPTPAAKTLWLGSHLDTVRRAGRFDGALGVLAPIVALAELRRRRVALPFAVEVIGFSEEEGVRFASGYLGSRAFTGQLRPADLALRDADGVTVREAAARWNGLSPGRFWAERVSARTQQPGARLLHLNSTSLDPSRLLGYVEVHIEQGPVLERERLAVGVVSAIAGQTRGRIVLRGQAGHAGTTPMALRRDALTGAAEFIRFVESTARLRAPLVATVGSLTVTPGAPNVIPGEVKLSLDVRHPRDAARRSALKHLLDEARAIARRRGLKFSWEKTQDDGAVACAPELSARLEASVQAVQSRSLTLVSGAGHDAVVISAVAPVAMLFVRCRDGLSHHPDEYAAPADLAVALDVLIDFLMRSGRPAAMFPKRNSPR